MVYRPTARVLTVLELLQAHGRMTGAELARRLEVDVRTVRNYVVTLVDLGIPVEAERGRYGAYRLRAGYKLPPLLFTEDEAVALTLSLLMAREQGLAAVDPAFEGALAKVERVLPAATRARIEAVGQTVAFERSSADTAHAAPSLAIVTALSAAVQRGVRLRLRYRSARAELTERAFDPYGVVAHEGLWYTIGYCHLRRGQRLLRLDRILAAEPTLDTFVPPAQFDALAAVRRALASVPRVWRVEVWLETTLEEARRRTRLSRGHFVETGSGDGIGVLVRVEVEDLPWMAHLLAGLGVPFLIRRPPELQEVVREYARTLARRAERTDAGCGGP